MPVKLVHASRGKTARAEPVAALYEAGRVRHVGQFGFVRDHFLVFGNFSFNLLQLVDFFDHGQKLDLAL